MEDLTAEALGEKWLSFTNEQRSELLSQRRENQLNEMALDKAPTDHGETTQPFRRMSAQMPRISPSFRTRTRNPDMPLRYSTVRGRAFGEGMRAAIARSGMTGRELADVLGWQEAKVSDMVNGKEGSSSRTFYWCSAPAESPSQNVNACWTSFQAGSWTAGGSRTASACRSGRSPLGPNLPRPSP